MASRSRVYPTAHIRAKKRNIVRNLVTELIMHEKVSVTKSFIPFVIKGFDKVINFAKKDTLAGTREAIKLIRNTNKTEVESKLPLFQLKKLAIKYASKPSGYLTSEILKLRRGDNSKIYRLSLT